MDRYLTAEIVSSILITSAASEPVPHRRRKILPDYREQIHWLKEHGWAVLSRMDWNAE